MEGFLSTILDVILLGALVLFIEQIKKFQKPETIEKWKSKKVYLLLFVLLCLPLAVITCMKDGVFDSGNSVMVIIGITFRTFFIMITFGSFFYDVIWKRLKKEKEGMNE